MITVRETLIITHIKKKTTAYLVFFGRSHSMSNVLITLVDLVIRGSYREAGIA